LRTTLQYETCYIVKYIKAATEHPSTRLLVERVADDLIGS
jgi:hypothetical protein